MPKGVILNAAKNIFKIFRVRLDDRLTKNLAERRGTVEELSGWLYAVRSLSVYAPRAICIVNGRKTAVKKANMLNCQRAES